MTMDSSDDDEEPENVDENFISLVRAALASATSHQTRKEVIEEWLFTHTDNEVIALLSTQLWAAQAPIKDVRQKVRTLIDEGAVVLPLWLNADVARAVTDVLEGQLLDAVMSTHAEWHTPPQLRPKDDEKAVPRHLCTNLGGFGGVQQPSINHCRAVALMRLLEFANKQALFKRGRAQHLIDSVFKMRRTDAACVDAGEKLTLTMLFDRAMVRHTGQKAEAKAWHRDCAQSLPAAAETFSFCMRLGGWVTMGGGDQHFAFVPGTHRTKGIAGRILTGGFASIKAAELKRERYEERVKTITSHKGECVLLFESLAHRPSGNVHKAADPLTRVFVAAEIGTQTSFEGLRGKEGVEKLRTALEEGAPMWLKSGQKLNLYPKMYWNFPKQVAILEKYAERMRRVVREDRVRTMTQWTEKLPDGRKVKHVFNPPKRTRHTITKWVAPSLKEQGLPIRRLTKTEWKAYLNAIPMNA